MHSEVLDCLLDSTIGPLPGCGSVCPDGHEALETEAFCKRRHFYCLQG